MAISPLAKIRVPADKSNYTPGRYLDYYTNVNPSQPCKITEITVHHMAGVATAESCGYGFQNPARNGSAHYGIGYDGAIANYVDENNTAWANSNWDSNCHAVTIEVSNSIYGDAQGWPVSDASLASLIKLVADIAKRNNLGRLVKGGNLTWHQMYAATACPGPYLLGKMDYIVAEANKLIEPEPVVKGDPKAWNFPYKSNVGRTTDLLVLYTNRKSSGTNPYGTEILLSSDGVVLDIEKNHGDMQTTDKGNRILSGHGAAATFLSKVKVGNHIYFSKGQCYIDSGEYYTYDGTNTSRRADCLVLYTLPFVNNTFGSMVAIDKTGKALDKPRYGITTLDIPEGGYVLSGHGTASKWLIENVKKGTIVKKIGVKSIQVK